jgi:hypothetical protein
MHNHDGWPVAPSADSVAAAIRCSFCGKFAVFYGILLVLQAICTDSTITQLPRFFATLPQTETDEVGACPGLGFCSNLVNAQVADAWPISTYSYIILAFNSSTSPSNPDACRKAKFLYDYTIWMLTDPVALRIIRSKGFSSMPKDTVRPWHMITFCDSPGS